jgi:Pin2-interacting protein X1
MAALTAEHRHRAKFIRSKRMALTDATAMAEVLGISSSSALALAPTSSAPASSRVVDLELEKITTSSKSVMDYFKEKLLAKTNPTSSVSSTFYADVDEDDTPVRRGLGSSRARITLDSIDEDTPSRGLGLGSAPSSSMPLLAIQPAAIPAAVTEEGGSAMKHKKSKKAKKDAESQPSLGDPAINDLVDNRQATPIIGPSDADDEDARRVAKLARKEARRMAKLAVPTSTP